MRTGRSHRADAITNSPFVRALIRPIKVVVPAVAALPPPASQHLIPTQPAPQPPPPAVVDLASDSSSVQIGQKRSRDDSEQDEDGQPTSEVIVSYTEDNLPPELNKCKLWDLLRILRLG